MDRDRSVGCDAGCKSIPQYCIFQVSDSLLLIRSITQEGTLTIEESVPIWRFSGAIRKKTGTLGYSRSVSLMQHSKYFNSVRSWRVHGRSESSNTWNNSSRNFS